MRPVAAPMERRLTLDLLADTVGGAEMELKETVLKVLDEVFQRFILNIGRPVS